MKRYAKKFKTYTASEREEIVLKLYSEMVEVHKASYDGQSFRSILEEFLASHNLTIETAPIWRHDREVIKNLWMPFHFKKVKPIGISQEVGVQ